MPTVPTLGFNTFDARFAPVMQMLQQQQQTANRPYPAHPMDPNDPNYDAVLDPHNPQYNPNDPRLVGGVSPYVVANGPPPQAPPISGPQQSYNVASNRPDAPQGTIANTGAPNTSNNPLSQAQSEIVGAGERGRGIDGGGESRWLGAGVPLSLGAPTDEGPPARHEDDFQAPALTGPQNPLVQRQLALRQQILQQAMANIPRGFHFKLG